MLRVLLADDHETTRVGVRSLLEKQPGWQVCGEAANGRKVVELATEPVVRSAKRPFDENVVQNHLRSSS